MIYGSQTGSVLVINTFSELCHISRFICHQNRQLWLSYTVVFMVFLVLYWKYFQFWDRLQSLNFYGAIEYPCIDFTQAACSKIIHSMDFAIFLDLLIDKTGTFEGARPQFFGFCGALRQTTKSVFLRNCRICIYLRQAAYCKIIRFLLCLV